jgi:restriction system protein
MSHAALHSVMDALMWKAVPIIILCGAVGLLVREALLRFERSINHRLESHRSGGKTEWTQHIGSNHIDESDAPLCPSCHIAMVKRKGPRGANAGSGFWGCSNYPECRETRALS